MNRSKVHIIFFLVFVLLICWGAPVFAAAANPSNTAADIQRLRQIILELQNKNNELTQNLKLTVTKLEDTQKKLEKTEAELAKLEQQLKDGGATAESYIKELEDAQRLLTEANQKLEEYQKKMEREIKSLKLQRNIVAAVAILALIF